MSKGNLILIIAGLFAGIVFVELVLRTYCWLGDKQMFGLKPTRSTLNFYDNDIFGSALTPNQKGWFVTQSQEYYTWVEVNSQGWPDVEHDLQKPEGVFRVLILGDSFVENFQVPLEKRFFRQLQNNLGQKYEVIAMGRGDTGTAQQYLILKNYGLKYKPDLVIQMFLTANDVKNNLPSLQNDPYLPYFEIDGNNNLKEIPHLKRSDRTLSSLKEMLKKFEITKIVLSLRQKYLEQKVVSSAGGYPIDYHVYDSDYSNEYQKAWNVTYKLISEIKKETENAKSKYLFIAFPGSEAVEKKKLESLYQTYPAMKTANPDLEKPNKLLSDFCQKENINYLFLQPPEGTYNWSEGHWNQEGTDFVADFIFNNLKNYLTIK